MNWLNLNVQTLDSENFLGSDPIDRATWLCLLRYCIGQENGGEIEDCEDWTDRKWQQLVRITKKEASRKCDLWSWNGNTLIVWGYPIEKETEVRQKRDTAKTNGAKGGRKKKTDDGNPEKPTLVNSAKAEGERKGKEGEGERNTPQPPKGGSEQDLADFDELEETPPLCTLEQALEVGRSEKISDKAITFWWHTRNAAGWTKGVAGGGVARKISNWRSDLNNSRRWAEEESHKTNQTPNGKSTKRGLCGADIEL